MKNILTVTLSALKVRHTHTFADKLFNNNPDRDNLFGLAYMLSVYGIKSKGYYIEGKDLADAPFPFIAHTNKGFVLATQLAYDKVLCHDEGGKRYIHIDFFKEFWSGYLLLIEQNAESEEIDYSAHRKYEHRENLKDTALLASFGVLTVGTSISHYSAMTTPLFIYLVLCLVGLGISRILLKKQWGSDSRAGNTICNLFSKGGCDTIAYSPGARVLFGVSWAEVGFGYFLATFLLLSFYPGVFPAAEITNLFALLFTFWSLWYQRIKVRKHCPLCIIILFIVWGLFAISAFSGFSFSLFQPLHLLSIPAYVITILLTHCYSRKAEELANLENALTSYRAILCQKEILPLVLDNQPFIRITSEDSHIIFGNPSATRCLTVISNPLCKPCANAHKFLERMLRNNDDLKIRYIFVTKNASMHQASRYLVNAFLRYGEAPVSDWFNQSPAGRKKLMGLIQESEVNKVAEQELMRHSAFIERNEILWTPTILLNGHKIPPVYSMEDLAFSLFD
jgi:hypothetical protein